MLSNNIITPAEYNAIIIIDGIYCGIFNYGDIYELNFCLIKPKIWGLILISLTSMSTWSTFDEYFKIVFFGNLELPWM